MRTVSTRMMFVTALVTLIATACVDEGLDAEGEVDSVGRSELGDEAPEANTANADAPNPLICGPKRGLVTRLFVGDKGFVRAEGVVFTDVGPCSTSIVIRLTRNGNLIDSQEKHCIGSLSCKSRLLSAGNPAADQDFCATVRESASGPVLDRKCIAR
jgi:hypothetical protein